MISLVTCPTISFNTAVVIPLLDSSVDGVTPVNVNSSFVAWVLLSFSTPHAVSSLLYESFVHGIHTYSFPFEPIITSPLLTRFSPSTFDTANPAGILAVFPSASV